MAPTRIKTFPQIVFGRIFVKKKYVCKKGNISYTPGREHFLISTSSIPTTINSWVVSKTNITITMVYYSTDFEWSKFNGKTRL